MKKVLVLGGSGLVGKAIISEMNKDKEFKIYGTYFRNPISWHQDTSLELNIEDSTHISSLLNNLKPQIVISCLRGDYDKQLTLHIKVAEYLKESGGSLFFFSTTNVFDNDLSKPHYEDDLPNSCTDYGKYKIECENRMIDILHDNACILRLPQIWGKDSPRMNELLNSLSINEKIEVCPNLFFNTNTDLMLANQLYYIIKHRLNGIFHLVAEDVINQKDFYNKLILGLGYNNTRIQESMNEKGFFALSSKRKNEFPKQLRITNNAVIKYLIENLGN
jgi:dTDP-4-dehydrorhamnose reductase